MARSFFFPHSREFVGTPGDPPGRVPFDVEGMLVDAAGVRRGEALVFADGYGRNQCASNQDPCVFSAPLGPTHAYCRCDVARGKDNYVLELDSTQTKFLPNLVRPGDTIFYGKVDPPRTGPIQRIWIDTVLVVARTVRWPTIVKPVPKSLCHPMATLCKQRKLQFRPPQQFAQALNVETAHDVFRYNLRDAEVGGAHCCTANSDPHVIEGAVTPTPEALATGTTSFVPIADKVGEEAWPAFIEASDVSPEDWAEHVAFFEDKVRANPRNGFICEMEHSQAMKLRAAIIAVSGRSYGMPGTVAVPPLTPAAQTTRWSFSQRAFVPA